MSLRLSRSDILPALPVKGRRTANRFPRLPITADSVSRSNLETLTLSSFEASPFRARASRPRGRGSGSVNDLGNVRVELLQNRLTILTLADMFAFVAAQRHR